MKINGEVPTGVMVALVPDNVYDLTLDGGEEADALHVTLKFLGDQADWSRERFDVLVSDVRKLSKLINQPQIEMLVTGAEWFGAEHDALALSLSSSEALALHQTVDAFTGDVPLTWPVYRPHLTLKYDKGNDGSIPEEVQKLIGTTLTFSTMIVCRGTDRRYVSFGCDDISKGFSSLLRLERSLARTGDGHSGGKQLSPAQIAQRKKAAEASARKRKNLKAAARAQENSLISKRARGGPNAKSSAKEIVGHHGHHPHGKSILWPALYEHLLSKGMTKGKAAAISNGMWNKKHGLEAKNALHSRVQKQDATSPHTRPVEQSVGTSATESAEGAQDGSQAPSRASHRRALLDV